MRSKFPSGKSGICERQERNKKTCQTVQLSQSQPRIRPPAAGCQLPPKKIHIADCAVEHDISLPDKEKDEGKNK